MTRIAFAPLFLLAAASAASAQPMGWGQDHRFERTGSFRPERVEGKVEVNTFVSEGGAAATLGKGTIAMVPASAGAGSEAEASLRVFESALLDQLASHGYDTASHASVAAQTAEVRLVRDVAVPEEAPHKPVSGEMTVGMSNRGSMMGMALAVDLSKPRKAMVSTQLEARIRNAADGAVIWEGRAEMLTRDGSGQWTEARVAEKLAIALLDRFPAARER